MEQPIDLRAAQAALREATRQIGNWQGRPDIELPAIKQIAGLIDLAGHKQRGWGRLRCEAMREWGKYVLREHHQGKGRPKMSDADISSTYARLGITDRRVGNTAKTVARIAQDVFDGYLQTMDEPTVAGLLRYAATERDNRSVDPITARIERDIKSAAKCNAVPRVSALRHSLDVLLHEGTVATERAAAAAAIRKLDADFARHAMSKIPVAKAATSTNEWRQRVADKDAIIVEYRKQIAAFKRGKGGSAQRKEIMALRAELADKDTEIARLQDRVRQLETENARLRRELTREVPVAEATIALIYDQCASSGEAVTTEQCGVDARDRDKEAAASPPEADNVELRRSQQKPVTFRAKPKNRERDSEGTRLRLSCPLRATTECQFPIVCQDQGECSELTKNAPGRMAAE